MTSSSPMHASFLESSKLHHRNHENTDLSPPSVSAAGAGSPSLGAPPRGPRPSSNSTQTRRLQLRNAGFRGSNVPGRRVTPSNTSSATTTRTWSAAGQTSDAENVSPSGRKKTYDEENEESSNWSATKRKSAGVGVLQDIGNSTASGRMRPRLTSAKFWTNADTSEALVALDNNSSPPQRTSSSTKPRLLRSRAKMNRPRRSISPNADQHIDYLERELEAKTAQLHAMASSDSANQQSDRLRHMNAELQRLQAEVADWENQYEERVTEATDLHHQREDTLRSRIRALEQSLEDGKKESKDAFTVFNAKQQLQKVEMLELQLKATTESLEKVEARNVDLEQQNERLHALLVRSATSPSRVDQPWETPGRTRRGRPMSMFDRVPTAGNMARSPDRYGSMQPTSPFFGRTPMSPGGPRSPLSCAFSPDVASPGDSAEGSDASLGTTIIHGSDAISKRKRAMRRLEGTGPKPLLLSETSLCDPTPLHSAPPFESQNGEGAFRFPPAEPGDGSPHAFHRRSSTESNALNLSRPTLSLKIDTTNTELEVDPSLKIKSPDSTSFDDTCMRNLSTGTADSTVGKASGRNLMEELTAIRHTSASTGDEPWPSDLALDETIATEAAVESVQPDEVELHSSPFDSEVEELPDDKDDREVVPSDSIDHRLASDLSTVRPPAMAIAKCQPPPPVCLLNDQQTRAQLSTPPPGLASNKSLRLASRASLSSLGAASNSSLSTLDSLRTVFSNLFRSPIDVVKHLVQAAQARMSIPPSLFSIPWWLVNVLLGPMARHQLFGQSSRPPDNEQQSLIEDTQAEDHNSDSSALCYSTAYKTPQPSPISVSSGTNSMVAGKGKKRASSLSIKNAAALSGVDGGKAAKHCPHQPRRWKHSPLLWLKFSMCLAVAVGVAFKDGPSSLLKEAVCQACKSKKPNWRKTNRDSPFSPSS